MLLPTPGAVSLEPPGGSYPVLVGSECGVGGPAVPASHAATAQASDRHARNRAVSRIVMART